MTELLSPTQDGERYELRCPIAMPHASAFLWNRKMLLQLNCRGYAVAQHMQPEPRKYSCAPILEDRTFIQPEQPFYAHHPGRFAYVSDTTSGELFSIPHEPVRRAAEEFVFSVGKADVKWRTRHADITADMSVSIPADDVAELWLLEVTNNGDTRRDLNVFPCFTIGYMSWMNQSAEYRAELGGIVASSVTPYQKVDDYPYIKQLKDKTVLLHDTVPDAWETCRDSFEGEGGIQKPDGITSGTLQNGDAVYETPVAALQYSISLAPGETRRFRFVFAPVRNESEIHTLRGKYLVDDGYERAQKAYVEFLNRGKGCLSIRTPDASFDNFVNHWLDRQVFYHGDANRLTTDPQTRNYLQDSMGMAFIEPASTRAAICRALGQQENTGRMPEGIVLNAGGELKYINRIPHSDHCVWLPLTLDVYLRETADYAMLDELVEAESDSLSVFDRITFAMRWLISNRDERGLSLIAQGDWCDPMNMVGHKGRGVSGWLSIATVHALQIWADISNTHRREDIAVEMETAATEFSAAVQKHLWDGEWFARGITDDGALFGVSSDDEGMIYLNPQCWALMSNVATPRQAAKITAAIDKHLDTQYGTMILAPAYTAMREDIGRVTQKHAGSGENGSIYNHASTFYIHALFALGRSDKAFQSLRKLIPGPDEEDYVRRGQLPVSVPNYYRGAVHQHPRTAGRSSQLFNTGAASWMYRIVIEDLFGLKGSKEGLAVRPNLPKEWQEASAQRRFRGATFDVRYRRDASVLNAQVSVDGTVVENGIIRDFEAGRQYEVIVSIPTATE